MIGMSGSGQTVVGLRAYSVQGGAELITGQPAGWSLGVEPEFLEETLREVLISRFLEGGADGKGSAKSPDCGDVVTL